MYHSAVEAIRPRELSLAKAACTSGLLGIVGCRRNGCNAAPCHMGVLVNYSVMITICEFTLAVLVQVVAGAVAATAFRGEKQAEFS